MITFTEHLILESTASDPKQLIRSNLNKIMRLDTGGKRDLDAFDLIEALEVLRKMFAQAVKTSQTTVVTDRGDEVDLSNGHRKGEDKFDMVADVKGAVESYFMDGKTETESMLNRRKYRALVTLILKPIANSFRGMSHEEIAETYNNRIDQLIEYIKDSNIVASSSEADVAKEAIARSVRQATQVQKAADAIMKLRKKAKKKRSN
jgi:hypothetical protein